MLFTHTRVATDMSAFLPKAATLRQNLLIGQLQHGPAARTIMVSLENASAETLAVASDALANRLAEGNTFGLIANGSFERKMQDRNWLFAYRYLLSATVTTERFMPEGLRQALNISRERLSTPSGDLFRPLMARDPTGELAGILEGMDVQQGPAIRHGVWFDGNGTRALLLLEIRGTAPTVEMQDAIKNEVERGFSTVASPEMRMILAGPAIYAVESRNLIEHESRNFTIFAAGLIVALLAWVYRNLTQMILVIIPAASGILAAVVLVSWYYGTIHGIALAFAIILLAETVDYPSYLLLQTSPELPLAVAARDIWPTLRLAVLTTLVGNFAMLFSGIEGLAQLGLLAVIGIAVAGLVNRWVVPALSPHQRRTTSTSSPLPGWLETMLRPRLWLAGTMTLLALLTLTIGGFSWEDDLGSLNPLPAEMKIRDHRLRDELGAPDVRFVIAVPASDLEQALRGSESLRPALDVLVKENVMAGYAMAADYLPSHTTQQARLAALPDPDQLRQNLPGAAQAAGFRPDVLVPFIAEITRARQLSPINISDIPDKAWRFRVESLLLTRTDSTVALITLKGVTDGKSLSAHANKLAPALLIDLKQEIGDLVVGYRKQILLYSGMGVIFIVALLFTHLHSLGTTLRVILPSLLGMLCTVAVLYLCNERLNLFHLVALLLVLGVGINYALFFNRTTSDRAGENRVLFSLLVCLLSTLIGFGALAASSIPILHSIGITSFCGTVFSFLFSAWLAPQFRVRA